MIGSRWLRSSTLLGACARGAVVLVAAALVAGTSDIARAAPPDDGVGRRLPRQQFAASWCLLALELTSSVDVLSETRSRLVEDPSADVVGALDQAVLTSGGALERFESLGYPNVEGGRELARLARQKIEALFGLLEDGRLGLGPSIGPDADAKLPSHTAVTAAVADAIVVVADADIEALSKAVGKASACSALREQGRPQRT